MPAFSTPQQREHGFALILAVLVAALLLAVGIAIFSIGSKELLLSAAARDSQFAFYAADTGIECALYSDFRKDAFSITTPAGSVNCVGDLQTVSITNEPAAGVYTRSFSIRFGADYCADVVVEKQDSPRRTKVEARGYNTCDTGNPRRVERAIRATY